MAEIKKVNGDYTLTTLGTGSDISINNSGASSDISLSATDNLVFEATNGIIANSNVTINGDLVVTGDLDFRNVKNRIYVSKTGNDTSDGRSWEKAKRTIKAACETAQTLLNTPPVDEDFQLETDHIAILVAAGDYTEICPITVPPGCAIIGDNLRSVTVRPSVATSDVFYLNSNCYIWGLTVRGHRLSPSALDITPEGYAGANGQHLPRSTKQTGFAFGFAPGAVIRVSPYIQNCSSISGSGVFGNPDYVPGGGGILVDPSVCAEGNRINSIVLDAFTQINQGGIGCKVVGRGYMQLVSFFVNFCQFGILCVDGGHVTLLNSNCSFGNYSFWAEGKRSLIREPDDILDPSDSPHLLATCTGSNGDTEMFTCDTTSKLRVGMQVEFAPGTGSVFGGVSAGTKYFVKQILNSTQFSVSLTSGGAAVNLSLTSSQNMKTLLWQREVIPYETARAELSTNRATYQNAVVAWVDGEYTSPVTATDGPTEYLQTNDTSWMSLGLPVEFTGTVFGGVSTGTTYYIVNIDSGTNQFKVSTTIDGSAENLSTAAGSMTVQFKYDSGKCKRDVGHIIDALITDLETDSFIYSRRAGEAYWNGVTSLIQNQEFPTVAAISELENQLVGMTGSLVGDVSEVAIRGSLATIKDFILNGPNRPFEDARYLINANRSWLKDEVIGWIATQVSGSIPPFSGSFSYDETICRRDLDYILDALVSDLITGTNRASRTAGNAYWRGTVDIPIPTPLSLINGQEDETAAAINQLFVSLIAVITNTNEGQPVISALLYPDGGYAQPVLEKSINAITDIINNGPDKDDLLISPTYEPARRLLSLNKEYIKEETVAYVNNELSLGSKVLSATDVGNYVTCVSVSPFSIGQPVRIVLDPKDTDVTTVYAGGGGEDGLNINQVYYVKTIDTSNKRLTFSSGVDLVSTVTLATSGDSVYCIVYDQDKCKRDVGYIVDAIISDLATNSQEATLMAGNAYWRGTSSVSAAFVSQVPDTLKAIDYAKRLALQIIKSNTTPPIGTPETIAPRDLFFKNDGTVLYVLGGVGPKVYQFTCASAWNTSNLTFVGSLDLQDQELTPQGMYIGDSGSKLYVVGTGVDGDELDGRKVYRYNLGTSWDITTNVSFSQTYDIGTQVASPSGIAFNGAGDKMYIVGSSDAAVYSYNLATAWDISNTLGNEVTYNNAFVTSNEDNVPTALVFNNNGSKLYVTGSTNDIIIEYSLGTPYDISTAVYSESLAVAAQEEEISGIRFRNDGGGNDGKKLYIIGLDSDSVNEFSLLTAWDITSAEIAYTTPVGYYSTPYQVIEKQKFMSRITSVVSSTNEFVCDTVLYLKLNQEIKFAPGLTTLGAPGSIFGGVNGTTTYYVQAINRATNRIKVSTTMGALSPLTLTAGDPTGSMVVAHSGASAEFEIEKNFNTIINIITNGATTLEEEFGSLVEATGYTLSYAGAGIDYSKLSKGQGGTGAADPNKYTIELDGGRVFITATDEKGDFYVGKVTPADPGESARPLFRINQATGAIDGRAFYQSIFGFMAPFVMALTRRK